MDGWWIINGQQLHWNIFRIYMGNDVTQTEIIGSAVSDMV